MSSSFSQPSDWTSFEGTSKIMERTILTSMLLQPAAGSSTATEPVNNKVYVEHNYVDHYNDPVFRPHEGCSKRRGPRGGVLVPFPEKLFQMLNQMLEDGQEDVVSWQPHGRCFVVHQPDRFVTEFMPTFFSQTKLTSFQRQVNLYGFRRMTTGADRNGYYHELFLRGRPDLLKRMTRVRVKGIGCKLAPSPATEPNFYRLPPCDANKLADMLLTEESVSTSSCKMVQPLIKGDCSSIGSLGNHLNPGLAVNESHGHLPTASSNALYFHVANLRAQAVQARNETAVPSYPKRVEGTSPFPAFSFASSLLSIHPNVAADDELMPLPSRNSTGSYLVDMQDEIINLFTSCRDLLDGENTTRCSAPPLPGNSFLDRQNDLAIFWELSGHS